MWVRFLKPYSVKPTVNTTTDYQIGHTANLPHAIAEAVIAAGAAEAMDTPKRTTRAKDNGDKS